MTDIVERLRAAQMCCGTPCLIKDARSGCECAEAADEIERLRDTNRLLRNRIADLTEETERLRERVALLEGEEERRLF